ncbi:MAG: Mrp/NBP35 family ATP-binding protein [Armatimonadota bacterium]|nr:Mrp/NBP35 family ATP-binding protein [Armatimonadota bacterium]MDR7402567.1 Mrp/NBP35 family ATP-binding protein [Armatimonadota bacterium]MDR7403834.1 Mrp/NBP35 family ATP-binding protein [Armatimonadota bacterium]MDR7436049.1 Mrp/NBP35 family ATP-binding protein [Armatimonadota bacterium]MDR7471928.1 Mrp/NBP35 family ATP-binding protein [Armatimonadota bacterium]
MTTTPPPTRDQILEALRDVQDPELHKSIVDLDMVRDIAIRDGRVTVDAVLTIGACPLRETIVESIKARVRALPGVRAVDVALGVMTPQQRQALIEKLRGGEVGTQGRPSFLGPDSPIRVIAVASGKGGVGKSTVTVNLAAALAEMGHRVGVVDADVYGFSIPRMLGVSGRPTVIDQMIIPLERDGIRVISIGFMLPDEEQAVIWRGPLLHKTLTTFLNEVHWGDDLEYLLLDLPPGTGDVSITIAQTLPSSCMLLVTTPQEAAVKVALRAAKMAEKVNMEVVGVVENMSYFRPSPGAEPVYIFGRGGGAALAAQLGVPLLAEVPLDPAVREGGDAGRPVVRSRPDSEAAAAFRRAAERLRDAVPVPARTS